MFEVKLLLKSVHLIDPAASRNGEFDVLIDGSKIERIGRNLPADGARVVELPRGQVVTPGLIDIHVHLREPGQEHKETIATGTAAAVAGGFTAVACMPNTDPINDHASVTEFILKRAAEAGLARVYPIGAVSIGSKGDQLTEIGDLHKAGCVAITDDGRPVVTALLMRRAMEYATMFGIPVIDHCEDPSLKGDGVAHEGAVSGILGLKGIPGAAESIMVERNISVAEMTGGHFHVAHMSARQSLRAVREGKARGIRVTCEVAPHHFVLTDEALHEKGGYDTNFKMNPPLRSERDIDALIEGVADGTITILASDHAPHCGYEKEVEFDLAPFGILGLETELGLFLDILVHKKKAISLSRLIEMFTVEPARLLGLDRGTMNIGAAADVTLIDPDLEWTVDKEQSASRSRNTPFHGWEIKGRAVRTIVAGKTVWELKNTMAAA